MAKAIEASGAEVVTVALRRVDWTKPQEDILSYLKSDHIKIIMPNTSGAMNAEEAFRLAILARKANLSNWIKLEIHPDPRYLMPDPIETYKAAELLIKEGFTVLPYIHADPVLAKRLQDIGCATVMPLASPIGSNQGLKMRQTLEIIIEQAQVPIIIDAGLGFPSHASEALEMGADAVLVNTAIAIANDCVQMAQAFRLGVEAGRLAYLSGPKASTKYANATSPLTAFLDETHAIH